MELDTGRHRSGQGRLINCGINRALTTKLLQPAALVLGGGRPEDVGDRLRRRCANRLIQSETHEFGLNNAHAIDSMLKHGGFSRHRLQGFL